MELADRPDLAPARDRGRVELLWPVGFNFHGVMTSQTLSFFVLGYITKSTVLVSVKICDFFFYCWRVHRVGEAKKKDTGVLPCVERKKKREGEREGGNKRNVSEQGVRDMLM